MFETRIIEDIRTLPQCEWNALASVAGPFLDHRFLAALEASGSVCAERGWHPQHIALFDDGRLVGAMPLYLKSHSHGEYVFDWAWAQAAHRLGLTYYPKLVSAVPMTPVTGARLLVCTSDNVQHNNMQMHAHQPAHCTQSTQAHSQQDALQDEHAHKITTALAAAAHAHARALQVSSLHCLFTNEQDSQLLEEHAMLERHGLQYHWHNAGYESFGEYLAHMSSAKRKKIKRERQRVAEQGVRLRVLSGDAHDENKITPSTWHRFYDFYRKTISEHGGYRYLNRDFFVMLGECMPRHILMITAEVENNIVATALFLHGDGVLYGRYWGGVHHITNLHFEVCYYRAIEYCIAHGFHRFEAGAQGEHKRARGFMPVITRSMHWIAHPILRDAVRRFLSDEQKYVSEVQILLQGHAPFRNRHGA